MFCPCVAYYIMLMVFSIDSSMKYLQYLRKLGHKKVKIIVWQNTLLALTTENMCSS
jgi:hypothetical protein